MSVSPPEPLLSRLQPSQVGEAAQLLHHSLTVWYHRNLNQPERFGSAAEPFRIFPEVYQSLDPGCAIAATDPVSGALLGLCFYHPRPTHYSVGIVATHPETAHRGVARRMLQEVLRLADEASLPVRLVSSLMSLDSFSLYTKAGFVPGTIFQDLQLPQGQVLSAPPIPGKVRLATLADVPAMEELEHQLCGIRRGHDFAWFLRHSPDGWTTLVWVDPAGVVAGFLVSIQFGPICMVGPGLTREEDTALVLLAAQLKQLAPANPVFLVPSHASTLIQALYAAGARNVELHVAQVRGSAPPPQGIIIPTFLPETG